MMEVLFTPIALAQLEKWKKINKKIYKRIEILIDDIQVNPFVGLGKPEPLKHEFKGYWSRRVNKEHRLIYKISKNSIIIFACRYHY